MDAKQIGEYAMKVSMVKDQEAWKLMESVCESIRMTSPTEPQIRVLVRQLYWDYHVGIEHLYALIPVHPEKIHEWIGGGVITWKCLECGDLVSLKFSQHEDYQGGNLGGVICARCNYERHLSKQAEADRHRHETKVVDLRALKYADYLQTEHWQEMRKRTLEADGHACRVCSSTDSLNVHHRTYDRLGEEANEDLITLCRSCHQLFHETKKLVKAES